MPPTPIVSLSNFLNAPSSSRKRPHADITRSSESRSRSPSPGLPSKRRRLRLHTDSPPPLMPPSASTSTTSSVRRTERDGYDYRRPVMASHHPLARSRNDITIDLTMDSDSGASTASPSPSPPRRRTRPLSTESGIVPSAATRRRPSADVDVIDLADDSDVVSVDVGEGNSSTVSIPPSSEPSSPEVQILHERRADGVDSRRAVEQAPVRRPTPPRTARAGPFTYLPEILRRSSQFMFGNAQETFNEVLLDRLDRLGRRGDVRHEAGGHDDFDINFDYRQPAFPLPGLDLFERTSETPQVVQEPYKAPPAPQDGFIRTFGEDDIILCPRCGSELAVGMGDVKQQVWVVKQCGHVYCGECATGRCLRPPKKNQKKPVSSAEFRECKVDGCGTKVATKTAMFPIYL